jgi:hypothetical protein
MTNANLETFHRYHAAVKRAVMDEWDPLGVSDLIDYLWWLETECIGLLGNRPATERFAERLLRIAQELEA